MTTIRSVALPLVLLGAGGHAKVLRALALAAEHRIIGICDPQLAAASQSTWRNLPVLGGDEALSEMDSAKIGLVNGIGQVTGNTLREDIYERQRGAGFLFPALVHPTAWLSPDTMLADGVQIMAGAIVQPCCAIGRNSIVNTSSSIDHDCTIEGHVHIAPGATICGGVHIATGAFIGAGAVILPGLKVGARAIVGAGVTLTHDLDPGRTYLGAANRLTATRINS